MNATTATRTCTRCDGNKVIEAFRHVNSGICALCGGTGTRPARKNAAANPRPRKAAAPKTGCNARLWAAFTDANPAEAQIIEEGMATDEGLAYAYSYVATYREADSHPALALALVAEHLNR
jgi:hypothetical protein